MQAMIKLSYNLMGVNNMNNNNGMYYNASVERTGVILTLAGMIVGFFIMLYGMVVNNAYVGLVGLFLSLGIFMLMPLFYKLAKVL